MYGSNRLTALLMAVLLIGSMVPATAAVGGGSADASGTVELPAPDAETTVHLEASAEASVVVEPDAWIPVDLDGMIGVDSGDGEASAEADGESEGLGLVLDVDASADASADGDGDAEAGGDADGGVTVSV